ncbi:MAG: hypothetical protein R2912_11840 [Eubacteriales bacterium]
MELTSEVVRIGISGQSAAEHYRLGKCIKKTAEELIARSWSSQAETHRISCSKQGHTAFDPSGPEFDRQATEVMTERTLRLMTLDSALCEEAAECGLGTFWVLAGTLDRMNVKSELLSYEGPFGVGYAVAAFTPEDANESRAFDVLFQRAERERLSAIRESEDAFVRLARETVEAFARSGETPALPDELPES